MQLVFIRHALTEPSSTIPIELWPITEKGRLLTEELCSDPILQNLGVIYTIAL